MKIPFPTITPRASSVCCCLFVSLTAVRAGSATWNLNPTSADWNTAANWTPATVPNSPTDIATFGVSNTTDISLSAATKLDSIVFDSGANGFTISTGVGSSFTIGGPGISNGSGLTQEFVLPVDSAGAISTSRTFKDIREFKQLLLTHEERTVARNLVGQLATYGTGAPIGFSDRKQVEEILDRTRSSGYGVRDIVHGIVDSDLFRKK